jgi:RNA recognition motif-containing protein
MLLNDECLLYFLVLEEAGGRSKGCGLVEYSTPDEAQHAIETLNDTELSGRKIFVREDREPDGGSISSIAKRGFAGGRGNGGRGNASGRGGGRGSYSGGRGGNSSSGGEGRQLYVGNLPWDMTWQSLKDVFRRFGEVERTEIASYPDGRSRGFGIVRFADSSAARQAIGKLKIRDAVSSSCTT